jgi:hypothetical protein
MTDSTCSEPWPLTNEQAQFIVAVLKRHLTAGATIRATDVSRVIEPQSDGTVYAGLTVLYPAGSHKQGTP